MQFSVQLLSIWRRPQWAMVSFTRNYPLYKPLHYLKQTPWIIIKVGKITNLQLLTVAWPVLQVLFFTPLNGDFKHLTCFEIQADKKRFSVNRSWQTSSFLRRVLGDTDGGLGTGKAKLICYWCSFRGLEVSVNHSSGGNLICCVCWETNLVCSVHSFARTFHVMGALWSTAGVLEWRQEQGLPWMAGLEPTALGLACSFHLRMVCQPKIQAPFWTDTDVCIHTCLCACDDITGFAI